MKRPSWLAIVLLVLWAGALCAGVYGYVNFGTETQRAAYATAALEQAFEHPISMSRLSVGVWPRPYAHARNVLVRMPWGFFYTDSLWVGMGWSSLFKGHFVPGHLVLEGPSLRLDLADMPPSENMAEFALKLPAFDPANPPSPEAIRETAKDIFKVLHFDPLAMPDTLTDLDIDFSGGMLELNTATASLSVTGIEGTSRLPGFFEGSAQVRTDTIRYGKGEQPVALLKGAGLALEGVAVPDEAYPFFRGELTSSASLDMPGSFEAMGLSLHTKASPWGGGLQIEGTGELKGLRLHGKDTDLQAALPFTLHALGQGEPELLLKKAFLHVEDNTVSISGRFAQARQSGLPTFSGKALIERLSLSRWFAFTRDMVPGLQVALDDLQGEMDLEITPYGLQVPRLAVVLSHIPFKGSASVDDFEKPNLRITGHTAHADVNAVFPELTGAAVTLPDWPKPAFGMGEGGGTSLDYDIRLSADTSKFSSFDCTGLSFQAASEGEGRFVNFEATGLYGGQFTTRLDIFDMDMRVRTQVSNVRIDTPASLIAGRSVAGGVLRAAIDVRGHTESWEQFLASLKGSINFSIDRGFVLAQGGRRQDFTRMDIGFQGEGPGLLSAGTSLAQRLPYQGAWNINMQTADWQATLDARGRVLFDKDTFTPLAAPDLTGRLQGRYMGLDLDVNSQIILDIQADRLEMRRVQGAITGGRISGSFVATSITANASARGQVDVASNRLRPFFERLGVVPASLPAKAFNHMQFNTRFDLTPQQWRFDDFSGLIDESRISGQLSYTPGAVPIWRFGLTVGSLDTALYMPPKEVQIPSNNPARPRLAGPSSVLPAKPWPVDILRQHNCVGQLSFESFTVKGLRLQRLRLPITLRGGVLQSDAVTASLYSGNLNGSLRFEAAKEGLLSRVTVRTQGVNMASLSEAMGLATTLGGRASSTVNLHGTLRSGDDIPRALSGNWNFDIQQGFFRPADGQNGQSRPTTFQRLSASGVLERGVISNDDLQLSGDRITVTGRGEINLVTWTLDYRMVVSSPGLRNIPVTLSGRLDEPERSISAMGVVLGAIGGLGANVMNLVQGVIFSPFRLLQSATNRGN